MYMSSQCAAENVTAIPTMIATIPMPVIAFAPLVAERLAYTRAARKGHLKLRQAAGRAISAAESGDWHWQIRTHLHHLALVTSEKYPAADHETLLGQLVDMPAH
jgi:hypothetical protein